MALKNCRECGQQVSTEADSCPHCGVPEPVRIWPAEKSPLGGPWDDWVRFQLRKHTPEQVAQKLQEKGADFDGALKKVREISSSRPRTRRKSSDRKRSSSVFTDGTAEGLNAGCGAIIVAGIVLWVGISLFSGGSDQASGPEHSEIGAYTACQELVRRRLRAPSTADFPWDATAHTTHEGGGRYTVDAHVDAENAFGAKLREDFECTVQYSGGGWDLISLTGL